VLFVVEVVPRSEDDVRISIALEAEDQLEALRRGLIEIGLESGWVGPAAVAPAGEGVLCITAPGGGLEFTVRRAGAAEATVSGAPTAELLEPALAEGAPAPLATSDEDVLDLSRLERYFADEDDMDAVESASEADAAPSEVGGEACVDARVAAPVDAAALCACVLARLADLEEHVYDVSGAMEYAARGLLEPLGADVVCVLLAERRGRALGFAGLAGNAPERLAKYRYPKGLGLPWLAYDERRALLVNGIDRDAGLHREVQEKTGFRIRATTLAPISSEGRTWGVVQAVRSALDAPDFGDADLAALEAAARRLGAYLALFGTFL